MNAPTHPLPTRAAADGPAPFCRMQGRRVLRVVAVAAVTASLVSTASPASADAVVHDPVRVAPVVQAT